MYILIIYKYLNLPRPKEDIEQLSIEISQFGNKIIEPNTLKQIITAVTPKPEEDLEKTINSSIHQKAYEKVKVNALLRKIKGSLHN